MPGFLDDYLESPPDSSLSASPGEPTVRELRVKERVSVRVRVRDSTREQYAG